MPRETLLPDGFREDMRDETEWIRNKLRTYTAKSIREWPIDANNHEEGAFHEHLDHPLGS